MNLSLTYLADFSKLPSIMKMHSKASWKQNRKIIYWSRSSSSHHDFHFLLSFSLFIYMEVENRGSPYACPMVSFLRMAVAAPYTENNHKDHSLPDSSFQISGFASLTQKWIPSSVERFYQSVLG